MTRTRLPHRRPSITAKRVVTVDGTDHRIILTVGFRDDGAPGEVFCASFKVGTALNAIVSDSCVLLSRLMQHGDAPSELAETLCKPSSLIGHIAAAVVDIMANEEAGSG